MSHKCEPYCISFKVSTLAQKRHFVACRCKNGVHFLYLFMSVDIWLSLSLDGMGDSRPYIYTHLYSEDSHLAYHIHIGVG